MGENNFNLAIIVPFRDRRQQLDMFVPHMDEFLSDKDIDYTIVVVEQSDDRPFNRGKLLNIGFCINTSPNNLAPLTLKWSLSAISISVEKLKHPIEILFEHQKSEVLTTLKFAGSFNLLTNS